MLFLVMGVVSATESINVYNTEDSNLIADDVDSLSENNKLEISNGVSISQTNIVNSHDDNLGDYCNDEVLNEGAESNDDQQKLTSDEDNADGENTLSSSSSSSDSVVAASSSNDFVSADSSTDSSIIAASPVSTKLSIADTHYGSSATYFDVTLKDNDGNVLANQKVTLNVNKKSYSAYTNANGVASVKTDSLNIGTYTVSLSYGGNSNYASSSLSKNVKVLSSAIGSDLTKYYGYTSEYKMTFWNGNSVLSDTKVTFTINGKSYTRTTDKNGVATLNINLAVGKHVVSVTNPYTKEKVSHKITVKKDKTKITAKSKTYIHSNKKGKFVVVLKTKHNALLKNQKVTFTYNNKKVTSKTNAKGEAKITIPVLAKGTYKIKYEFTGNGNLYAKSGHAKLIVADPTTKVSSSIVVMYYHDATKFKVKLTNSNGKVLPNKNVNIKINGKTTVCKTNSKGYAKLSLKNVNPGTYSVKYSYSKYGSKDYSHGSNRVIILKLVAKVSAGDLTMKANENADYKVTVKDQSGKLLKGVFVKSTVGGKSYIYQTDSNGVAKFKVTQGVGYYSVKSIVADPYYKSASVSKHITVKGTKFIAQNTYVPVGNSATYSVKLVNEKNTPVKDKEVKFTFNNKVLTSKTNSKGVAKVSLGVLSKGTHNIEFNHESAHGSAKIYSVSKVAIKDLVASSKSVKNYISKHSKLPSSVKVGDVSFKTADYLYLVSKAVVNLKAGNKNDIPIKILSNPKKPKTTSSLGYLKNYLSVAKRVVKVAESKGVLPNSVSSKVGTIGYGSLVGSMSDALVYYGKHNKMPSYVAVKSVSGSASTKVGGLNSKNTISNLAAYLAASKNCEVNDAKIKQLVTKLTKNCKTEKQKANAIFKFVRDTLSYSFYYNTKYGAAGTLKTKSGNCVDHAHLTVAMFRAAGLATRYVHAKCTFTSGHTYGHVFAQVLIGNTWTVADATSSRNSLGKIGNWNTHTYKLESYSSSISF
ncbi:MAG: hypothetical protein IJ258_08240 [Methanobrevibacter sp.]|uniref:Ig-like domain-containing protein n=1 Tax=Methanobrevibacter sp. TaxID=66852 RepID=UPI0025DC6FCE|nr:Ig-like domain-containing protein [Methanobrevibacter sp.]MBQ8018077.1 hypothetical protein [Methanobrevibacter sp.]